MRVHRATDIEEQQYFHAIAPLGLQLQVEPAGIARRAVDRAVEVQFLWHTFAREAPQPAQCDLDVARVEFHVAVQVAEGPLVPDLDRAARPAAVLPDADAFRVVAVSAEGTGAAGADPFRSTQVPPALFFEALLQRFHQLVPATQCFHQLFVVLRQVALEFLLQPLLRNFRANVEDRIDVPEIRGEREVETVEMLLILHEAGARQHVEIVDRLRHDALVQRLQQRQQLARGHGQLVRLEVEKKTGEHGLQRSSWNCRWRFTAGHSPSMMLNTTVSRFAPSGIN